MTELAKRHCTACTPDTPRLNSKEVTFFLTEVPGFKLGEDGKRISRLFEFRDFGETMAFVNAVAWIANREEHHPDLEVSFKTCRVHFTTHDAGGLTDNDFIAAAKINALFG